MQTPQETPPPIPPPDAACPHCGQVLENTRAAYCSHCGAALTASSSAASGFRILGAICLGLVSMVVGGLGACFLLIGGMDMKGSRELLYVAAGLILVAGLMLWGMIKLIKR